MNQVEKTTGVFNSFDGTQIYYEVRGQGEPLIFVYGIACLMNHWHHQVSHFAQTHKVITFDLRGHHKSTPVQDPRNLTMESLAKDVLDLLAHLEIPSAHFLGHSFGTPVALEVYRLQPEVVKSFVFINGFSENPIQDMFGLNIVGPFYEFLKSQYNKNPDLWNSLWKMSVDSPITMYLASLAGGFNLKLTHFKDIEVYVRGVASMNLDVFLKLFEELMKFNGTETLASIAVPTLIISGDDDRVTPKKYQKQMHDLVTDSEWMSVPYGSHCTQLDFPEFINLKLDSFYKKIST